MEVQELDFELPAERIAQYPVSPRDRSRLLVYDRQRATVEHRHFADIGDYLQPHDALVVNKTRVLPARLLGIRVQTGGQWEGLFLGSRGDRWELMSRTRGSLQRGELIRILEPQSEPGTSHAAARHNSATAPAELYLRWLGRTEHGTGWWQPILTPLPTADLLSETPELPERETLQQASGSVPDAPIVQLLERWGTIPLPPYIRAGQATATDATTYQTVYAEQPGAVAAPTAGLHFTPQLLQRLQAQGVSLAAITLHVGPGTFQPIKVQNLSDHQMHAEWCEVTAATANQLNQIRQQGGRIVAVGTTVARTLESAWQAEQAIGPFRGETCLFITPGHTWRSVDALITNFHLPRSTLLLLVAALVGVTTMRQLYQIAIQENYRFYSYGDAMLIL